MNLTGRQVYIKGGRRQGKTAVTTLIRRYWSAVASVGCIVAGLSCGGRITIHHCGTGAGGRKDHGKVIPLCWNHHLGPEGIDGKRMSKRAWQDKYGTELVLLKRLERLLKKGD